MPKNRPEQIVLSTSLDLLSVFGSTVTKKPDKTAEQLLDYKEITHHFPAYHISVGSEGSLAGARAKKWHCCEDKCWKALAGHPEFSSLPLSFLTFPTS